MTTPEAVFFWITALCLAAAFFFSLTGAFFGRRRMFTAAFGAMALGFVSLTVFGVIRWIAGGHPPFVTLFESMLTSVWFVLLIVLLARLRWEQSAPLLIPASLCAFLLIGWSSSLETTASPLSAALSNTWLFIHASFATAGAATFVVAASLSALSLAGQARLERMTAVTRHVPEHAAIPRSTLRLLLLGLILWGVMIVSGSIWAHVAWGRYWAWDPIELWSLISWLLYALVVHARITFKMSHRLFGWLVIIAAACVVFALWGVGYVYETIHSYG